MSATKVTLPPDDLRRHLTLTRSDQNEGARHIGMVGDTYTVVVSGEDTDGRFSVLDMFIPTSGKPQPHRHDFEETFIVLEGELEVTFRGQTSSIPTGGTVNIPSNAPHQVHNRSSKPLRMLCICAPAGVEKFFAEIGVLVATRITPPPELGAAEQASSHAKAEALAPLYRIEMLDHA